MTTISQSQDYDSERPIRKVLDRLKGVRRLGASYMARCPAHDDRKASLSVKETTEGDVLLNCFADCPVEEVVASMGLKMPDLYFQERPRGNNGQPEATYDYVDEKNQTLFQVVRYPGKKFLQRRPDGAEGWVWKLGDTRRVLYRLPEVLKAVQEKNNVYFVEGEKDADNVSRLGLCATCIPGGSGGKWLPAYSKGLSGAIVIIIPDNDDPGRGLAERVKQKLQGVAAEVKVVELPDLSDKGDVSDWIEAQPGTSEEKADRLQEIVTQTPVARPAGDATDPDQIIAKLRALDKDTVVEVAGPILQQLSQATRGLDSLDELKYRAQAEEALKGKIPHLASWMKAAFDRTKTDDGEIPGDLSSQLQDPEPWPEEVNGHELADELRARIETYVHLQDGDSITVTAWIFYAHTFKLYFHSPFLLLGSPEPGCGKSTMLDFLEMTCPRPIVSSNTSEATTFRRIARDKPTLLMDEVENLKEQQGTVTMMNGSWKRNSAHVDRMVGEGAAMDIASFDTFCPKAFAAIRRVPPTILDRGFQILMEKATKEDGIKGLPYPLSKDVIPDDYKTLREIKSRLMRWAQDNLGKLGVASGEKPRLPPTMINRIGVNWSILADIARVIGGEWPDLVNEQALVVLGRADETDASLGRLLLTDMKTIYEGLGFPAGGLFTNEILEGLQKMSDRPWATLGKKGSGITAHNLSGLLRGFDLKSKSMRRGSETSKGFGLDSLKNAWRRYVPQERGKNTASQRHNPINIGVSDHSEASQTGTGVTDLKSETTNDRMHCDGVTDEDREEGGSYISPLKRPKEIAI